jgi:hypothetical protein
VKKERILQWLATISFLTLLFVVWQISRPARPETPGQRALAGDLNEVSHLPVGRRLPQFGDFSKADSTARRSTGTASPHYQASVDAAQVLAVVNKTPITLRDLMPLALGETEMTLSHQEYDSRLQRAIEIELTFQAARSEGVELTAKQKQRLDAIVTQDQSDLQYYKQYGLSWSSDSQEQTDFEKRVITAQMLEQNLIAIKSSLAPSPDPVLQERYEEARRELLGELEAKAKP